MKRIAPWRTLTARAKAEADEAERRLHEARKQREKAERLRERALQLLAENHISPKLQTIFREGRG